MNLSCIDFHAAAQFPARKKCSILVKAHVDEPFKILGYGDARVVKTPKERLVLLMVSVKNSVGLRSWAWSPMVRLCWNTAGKVVTCLCNVLSLSSSSLLFESHGSCTLKPLFSEESMLITATSWNCTNWKIGYDCGGLKICFYIMAMTLIYMNYLNISYLFVSHTMG